MLEGLQGPKPGLPSLQPGRPKTRSRKLGRLLNVNPALALQVEPNPAKRISSHCDPPPGGARAQGRDGAPPPPAHHCIRAEGTANSRQHDPGHVGKGRRRVACRAGSRAAGSGQQGDSVFQGTEGSRGRGPSP